MNNNIYKRILSLVLTVAMVLSYIVVPASADVAAKEKVTAELTAFENWGATTTYLPFTLSAATKTALEGASWYVAGAGGSQTQWTQLKGKILVDGVEQEGVLLVAPSGNILLDGFTGWSTMYKTITLPKENVFTLTRAWGSGATKDNGGELQFSKTYVITLNGTTSPTFSFEPEAKEIVTAELTAFENWGATSYLPFTLSADTKTALEGTSWYLKDAGGNQYQWAQLKGTILVDGVAQVGTILVAPSGNILLDGFTGWSTMNKIVTLPRNSVFTLTRNFGTGTTKENGGQVRFVEDYVIILEAGKTPVICKHTTATVETVDATCTQTGLKTINCGVCGYNGSIVLDKIPHNWVNGVCSYSCGTPMDPKEKLTVELNAYANWASGGYTFFTLSTTTQNAMDATSWYATTGTSNPYWAQLKGTALVDGVETEVDILMANNHQMLLGVEFSETTKVILPKGNVFTLQRAGNAGTKDNGGQVQFADDYVIVHNGTKPVICKHTDTTTTREEPTCQKTGKETVTCDVCGHVVSTTVLDKVAHNWVSGVCSYGCNTPMDAKEKVVVALDNPADWASDGYTYFIPTTTTNNALDATSWFASTGNFYNWAHLKGIANVNGVDQEINIRIASNHQLLLGVEFSETTKVLLSKDSVFYLQKAGNAGTKDNGGQIQFAEDYAILYSGGKVVICKHTDTTTTREEPTCQKTGKETVTCVLCGRHMGTTVLDKAAHKWLNGECSFGCGTPMDPKEKVTVELNSYANWASGGYTFFTLSTATQNALDATSWYATTKSTNPNWARLIGMAIVDGVETEVDILMADNHQMLLGVEFGTTIKVVLPKGNVFALQRAGNAGTKDNGGQIQFAEDYVIAYYGGKPVVCKHTDTTATREEPTCQQTGLETVVCSVCGLDMGTNVLDKVPHNWVNGQCSFGCGTAMAPKEKVAVALDKPADWASDGYTYFIPTTTTNNALDATSWFASTGNFYNWAHLKGIANVNGVDQEINIRIASNHQLLLGVEFSETTKVLLSKDSVFYLQKAGSTGTKDNGGLIRFADDYVIVSSGGKVVICKHTDTTATREEPTCQQTGSETVTCNVCGRDMGTTVLDKVSHNWVNGECSFNCGTPMDAKEKVTVELGSYTNWGTDFIPFSVSATTKNALEQTSWFVSNSGGTSPQWAKLNGKMLVNGVEQECAITLAPTGELLVGDLPAWANMNATIVLPKENVYNLTQASPTGTKDNGGQLQFAKNYEIKLVAGQKPVVSFVVAANEIVTVELGSYTNWGDTFIPFGVSNVTKNALEGTSWFIMGAGNGTGEWAKLTGKMLVDGVEQTCTITIASTGELLVDMANWKTENATIVLPKENVYTLTQACKGGSAVDGGQLKFAKTYEIALTAGSKPVVSFEVAANEIVTAELGGYTNWGTDFIPFSVSAATKTALEGTSWFDLGAGSGYPQWAKLTGKVLVDGVEQTRNIAIASTGEILVDMAGWQTKNATIVLPKENVYTLIQACAGGTTTNGGQLRFIKTYTITLTAGNKPVISVAAEPKEKVTVELGSYTNWGTDFIPFSVSAATKDALGQTSWFVLNSGGTSPQWAKLNGKMLVNGVEQDCVITMAPTGELLIGDLPAWANMNATIVLPKENVYNLTKASPTGIITNGGQINFAETYTICVQQGLVAILREDPQISLNFAKISDAGHWYFSTDRTAADLGEPADGRFFKATAEVDGKPVNVWFEQYADGKMIIYGQVILDKQTSEKVVPAQSLKIKAGTPLIPVNGAGNVQIAGVKAFVLTNDVELRQDGGHWLDSQTPIQDMAVFYTRTADNNYWYFEISAGQQPQMEAFLKGQAIVDGKEQTVYFHYASENRMIIYSQCFTEVIPAKTFQLKEGTLLVQYTAPNGSRIAGAPVYRVTNETNANKAEGILWIGSSANKPEKEAKDPIYVTVAYTGNTDNMMWLKVENDQGKALKDIYGNRKALSGTIQIGLLNEKETVTQYTMENVTFNVLDGALYMSAPGLNALEMVHLEKGTVLIPATGANSDRAVILKDTFHIERNESDKWVSKVKLTSNTETPKTGDDFALGLVMTVMVVSLFGLVIMYRTAKKKKYE